MLKIEQRAIEALIPYARNSRTHSEAGRADRRQHPRVRIHQPGADRQGWRDHCARRVMARASSA